MRSKHYRPWLTSVGAAILGWTALCGPTSAGTEDAATITVRDFTFEPMSVTVKAGSTVTWENKDDEPHTVVDDTGLFRSGALDTNERFSFRFDKPGRYRFTCSIHPRMVGTVVVH